MKRPEHAHVYEKLMVDFIKHIDNGWIVTATTKEGNPPLGEQIWTRKYYFDYDRLSEALIATGNGSFEQCKMCGDILKC